MREEATDDVLWRFQTMRFSAPLLLFLFLPCVHAAPLTGDLSCEVRAGRLVFANSAIALEIDLTTGSWCGLRDLATGRTLMAANPGLPGQSEKTGNEWLPEATKAASRYLSHRVQAQADGAVLEVDQEAGDWRATTTYQLWSGRPVLKRDLQLRPRTDLPGYIRSVRLPLDGLELGGVTDASYSLLANWPPQETAFSALTPGRQVGESFGGQAGHFLSLYSPQAQTGLVATLVCETDQASLKVTEGTGSVRADHTVNTTFHPRPDRTERFGSQLIAVTHGSWRETLRQGRDLYNLIGLRPPEDMRQATADAVIYSAHPGGTIDSSFRDVGGFRQFTEYLPQLKRLGVNVLWLLPIWKGPVYAPIDYYSLDPRLGTQAELKTLVDTAHSLGIRVLGDLIPHGPREESGLAAQHRDWICSNEDGSMAYWWGCLYSDYAHPGWQKYMGDHAADWVKRVGLDGYRVDCAGGGRPNWRPYGTNRESMSGICGGLGVLRAARESMNAVPREATAPGDSGHMLLAEAGGPVLLRYADMYYDWPLCSYILREYPTTRTEDFVPRLAKWLDNEQFWMPEDGHALHFLENHDTVRARMAFGAGPERALMALCAFIPGTPFVYHFQETGLAPYLQRLYELRRERPELTRGDADYSAVRCSDPCLLTFVRRSGDSTSLVAINLSEKPIEATLSLPPELSAFGQSVSDALASPSDAETAVTINGSSELKLTIAPFATAVLVPQKAPVSSAAQPSISVPTATAATRIDRSPEAVTVDSQGLKLTVNRATGGLLSSLQTSDGRVILRGVGFGEGFRRLWLGGEKLALERTPVTQLTAQENPDGTARVEALASMTRSGAAAQTPLADLRTTYDLGRDPVTGRPVLSVSRELTAREPVRRVLGSLVETLALDPQASEWQVITPEGTLRDWMVARLPRDSGYDGRYWRGTGDRVWQLTDQLAGVEPALVAVQSTPGQWTAVEIADDTSQAPANALLKTRSGEQAGPYLRIDWLDGNRAVELKAGEKLAVRYRVLFPGDAELARAAQRTSFDLGKAGSLQVRGTQYRFLGKGLDATFSRFGGGKIGDLRLRGAERPVVTSSRLYTDQGLYADIITPDMRKVRNTVTSEGDPEAEARLSRDAKGATLYFYSAMRTQDGRSCAWPRTMYRVQYGLTDTTSVEVKWATKTAFSAPQAKPFMAQTLRLPRLTTFRANARAGLVTGAVPPNASRAWQSWQEGFGADPWLELLSDDGTGIRLSGPGLASDFQNVFALAGGDSAGTAFLALHDTQPVDIDPVWHEGQYTLTPLREAH